MLYNSIGMLILDIIVYFFVYIVVTPLLFFIVLNIIISILKLRTEQNDKKLFIGSIIVAIVMSIVLSYNISFIFMEKTTSIKGKKYSDLKSLINQIVDFNVKSTEIIYVSSDDIKTFNIQTTRKSRSTDRISYRTSEVWNYYLDIRNGDYIIPLSSMAAPLIIEDLLYNNNYGEQVNYLNEIEVYKNTKYIKSINGIDIDSDYETRKKFSKEKEYKIKIKISENGVLQYETEGCTLEEYIHNNEDVTVGVYNERGECVVIAGQLFGSKEEKLNKTFLEELNINKLAVICYPDGIYYAYVCKENLGKLEIISNAVKFRVEKRKAVDF